MVIYVCPFSQLEDATIIIFKGKRRRRGWGWYKEDATILQYTTFVITVLCNVTEKIASINFYMSISCVNILNSTSVVLFSVVHLLEMLNQSH